MEEEREEGGGGRREGDGRKEGGGGMEEGGGREEGEGGRGRGGRSTGSSCAGQATRITGRMGCTPRIQNRRHPGLHRTQMSASMENQVLFPQTECGK